jgi:hypothetical protein
MITVALQLAMLVSLSTEAIAADIRPFIHGAGSYREIAIEGPIQSGDFETFIKIIRENQGHISSVQLFSPGGNFYEAMKIGRAMRTFQLHSQAPMRDPSGRPSCDDGRRPNDPKNCTCASACFFIHIGAAHKGGTFLAVHRPYFEKGHFGKLSEAEAKKAFETLQDGAREYMQEMGVPKHIQEDVLGTPSDRALLLDEKTIKTYFWGGLPYLDEWKKNKCSRLSNQESERAKSYSRKLSRATKSSPSNLSNEEWADLGTLQKKQKEESDCEISINRQSRVAAYEKYFHVKPSDYANHDFSRWSSAANYLGKSFYELLSEERFDEDRTMPSEMSFLTRSATASAPSVNLSDFPPRKLRVVTSVALVSTPNPSQEFIQKLVASLEAAWGRRAGGNGSSEWQWNKDKFTAKLIHEPRSATGPYLSLRIRDK